MQILSIYLSLINALLLLMLADKQRAKNTAGASQNPSCWLSALGGSLGACSACGSSATRRARQSFSSLVPLLLAAPCALLYWLSVH